MKKIYLLFLALIMISHLKGQPFAFQQYFEGQFNSFKVNIDTTSSNVWQIGKPQKKIFNSAASIPNVIVTDTINYYPPNNTSRFYATDSNSTHYSPVMALQWKQKLDLDQGKDGGIIEFSTNGGTSWINAHNCTCVYQFYGFQPANKDTLASGEFAFSGADTTWRDIWLCLNGVNTFTNSIIFRFTLKSDSINNGREGWMIDNMILHRTIFHPVKETSGFGDLVVYPNTTTGIVNVEMKQSEKSRTINNITLKDHNGKLIENYGPNYAKVVLDISKYPEGIYYLNVTVETKTRSFKVIHVKN